MGTVSSPQTPLAICDRGARPHRGTQPFPSQRGPATTNAGALQGVRTFQHQVLLQGREAQATGNQGLAALCRSLQAREPALASRPRRHPPVGRQGVPTSAGLGKEHGHVCLESRAGGGHALEAFDGNSQIFLGLEWGLRPTSEPSSSEAREDQG